MSHELIYEQQLIREHELAQRAEVSNLNLKKAQLALAEAEKEISSFSKLFPFMAKSEKATVENAYNRVKHWEQKEHDYQLKREEAVKQLDVDTLTKIREEGSEEYLKGQKIKDFYSLAKERVDVFRMRVRDFLKALGQARGAMSTGYNNANEDYSQNAKERLEIALKEAHKLDIALSDIEMLNLEFKAKAEGTSYSKLKMPSFSHAKYEAGIRTAQHLPIAQAQIEFEKTLNACEELHDQGIDDVIQEIDALEDTHEEIMLEVLRKYWRGQQIELLKDSERVQEIRSTMNDE